MTLTVYERSAIEIVGSARAGTPATFESHGKNWDVRKLRHGEYSFGVNTEVRRRYGRLHQIRADVAYALEFGNLPPRIDHAF